MGRWIAAFAASVAVGSAGQVLAQCGGLCLYENGSPDIGRAAAGAGARAQDASTAFWNPAGLTELEGSEIMFGVIASFATLDNRLDAGTVTPDASLRDGGDASGFAPLLGGFVSTELGHGIHFGLASTALYGGAVDYDTNWTGRGYVTDASLISFLIQPSFAYAVTDWLSLGAGPTVLYTTFNERLKLTGLPGEPTVKLDNADSWSAGGAFSALIKPLDGTRVGVYYRTEMHADTQGRFEGPPNQNPTINADFTFPQGVNVSVYQQIDDAWALLADAGWTDWSAFSNIPLQVGPLGATQRRGWQDTWRAGVGFQYVPRKQWTLQGGFGYDSSPVKASRLLPDIPAGEQYRFSTGLQYRPKDYVELSVSYQFLWLGQLSIGQVSLPPSGTVVLDGDYSPALAHQAGVNVRVKF
jgi:long-chain fatty acid transport protein